MMNEKRVEQNAQPEETNEQTKAAPIGNTPEGQSKPPTQPSSLEELEVGMRLKGTVRRILQFGAFVDIGVGTDGLAHISTLQRAGIDKSLKEGDTITVVVRNVDTERRRISLTIPRSGHAPRKRLEDLEVGAEVKGRVVRLVDFGAFVDIGAQTDGLLHVSELSNDYVRHPSDVLEIGQEVQVRIIDIDIERQRLSLSMKDEEPAETIVYHPEEREERSLSAFAVAWQEALNNRNQRMRVRR